MRFKELDEALEAAQAAIDEEKRKQKNRDIVFFVCIGILYLWFIFTLISDSRVSKGTADG